MKLDSTSNLGIEIRTFDLVCKSLIPKPLRFDIVVYVSNFIQSTIFHGHPSLSSMGIFLTTDKVELWSVHGRNEIQQSPQAYIDNTSLCINIFICIASSNYLPVAFYKDIFVNKISCLKIKILKFTRRAQIIWSSGRLLMTCIYVTNATYRINWSSLNHFN